MPTKTIKKIKALKIELNNEDLTIGRLWDIKNELKNDERVGSYFNCVEITSF